MLSFILDCVILLSANLQSVILDCVVQLTVALLKVVLLGLCNSAYRCPSESHPTVHHQLCHSVKYHPTDCHSQ